MKTRACVSLYSDFTHPLYFLALFSSSPSSTISRRREERGETPFRHNTMDDRPESELLKDEFSPGVARTIDNREIYSGG